MEPDDPEMEEKDNLCPICFRAFGSIAGLRQHWSKSHTVEEISAIVAKNTQKTHNPTLREWRRLRVMLANENPQVEQGLQFDIVENAASGDCLFLSLLDFLHRHVDDFENVPQNATDLRIRAVEHILQPNDVGAHPNFERFKADIKINLHSELDCENASDDSLMQSYSQCMSTSGIYGTTCELCAVAEIFGFGFNVVQRDVSAKFSCYDYGSVNATPGQAKPVAHLLFTGNISNGHFRLLLPVDSSIDLKIPMGNYDLIEEFTSSRIMSIAPARPIALNTAQLPHPTHANNSATYVDTPSPTIDFKCDVCGRSFDSQRGLSVHRNRHKDEPESSSQPTNGDASTETSFEDFVILLARCKAKIRVLKRVPRGARIVAAIKLAQSIEDCLTSPHLDRNWKNLLTFAYTALRVPDKVKNASLVTLVKRNVEKSQLIIPRSQKRKKVPISLSKRIEHKIAEGNVKGAVKILSSSDTLAPHSMETLSQLQSKHPPPSRELHFPDPPVKNTETLVVTERDAFYSVKSFPNGSGSGIDGLLPQHLKDLTLPSTGEAGLRLLRAITGLTNYMLSGRVRSKFIEIMYGASLCALEKKQGGIRPIAVGNTFRRITSKLSSASVRSDMASKFAPRQVGFGIRGGCEAAAHATRTFIKRNAHRRVVVVKIDFRNAFNEIDRDVFLNEMKIHCPGIFPYLWQCYASPTLLFYGDFILLSQNGAQQGDPCGPLVFSSAIQAVVEALVSEFVVFYLDDGTIAGDYESVLSDLKTITMECAKIGLHINPTKCELYFCSDTDQSIVNRFNEVSPGICIINELSLLGAPISDNAFEAVFKKKLSEMKLLFGRLAELDSYHIAFYILKNCFAVPKLVFLLRTSPTWIHNDLIDEMDQEIKSALEVIRNSKLDTKTWSLSSLPIKSGGIGVRKIQDTALPAFLSSVNAVSPLVSTLLHHSTLQVEEIADYQDGLNMWKNLHPEFAEPESPSLQREWNKLSVTRLVNDLNFDCDTDKARFLAIQRPESGAWLQALPSKSIGTLLDNNSFRIIVGLRLGIDICVPHICRCGAQVDSKGHHGLKCRYSAGRYARHSGMNNIIKRTLISADIPARLEPVGLVREDGKRVDGMSLIPWSKGRTLIWDATCTDTLAPSNLRFSTRNAGKAAEVKAQQKTVKYRSLINQNYHFIPFAVETMGPWSSEAIQFFETVSKMIATKSKEPRSRSYLQQRLSMEIQRGNAASVMGTFRDCDKMDEIFYL